MQDSTASLVGLVIPLGSVVTRQYGSLCAGIEAAVEYLSPLDTPLLLCLDPPGVQALVQQELLWGRGGERAAEMILPIGDDSDGEDHC